MTNFTYDNALESASNNQGLTKALKEIIDSLDSKNTQDWAIEDWLERAQSHGIRKGYLKSQILVKRYVLNSNQDIGLYTPLKWIDRDSIEEISFAEQDSTIQLALRPEEFPSILIDIFPMSASFTCVPLIELDIMQLVFQMGRWLAEDVEMFDWFWNYPDYLIRKASPKIKKIAPGLEIFVPEIENIVR